MSSRAHDPMMDLGDFTATRRMVPIAMLAIAVGILATFVARLLLDTIALATNVFYYQRLSLEAASPADHRLGLAAVLVPVAGAVIIGLMARYGSERIRGHGIPEALEAILFGRSRMEPKVAVLKPLSSAISIGTGGPFGAEGPIIMTGGAIGSLIAQGFHLSSAERKTLLVAGAAGGMSATFGSSGTRRGRTGERGHKAGEVQAFVRGHLPFERGHHVLPLGQHTVDLLIGHGSNFVVFQVRRRLFQIRRHWAVAVSVDTVAVHAIDAK